MQCSNFVCKKVMQSDKEQSPIITVIAVTRARSSALNRLIHKRRSRSERKHCLQGTIYKGQYPTCSVVTTYIRK